MASCQACSTARQPTGEDLLQCAGGCNTFYCSKACQGKGWKSHKLECKAYQSHTCWICQKSGHKGNPVYRSCACRGDKGFGHLHCFVDYAKERPTPIAYTMCHMCKNVYRNEIQRVLAKQMNQAATTIEQELSAKLVLSSSHLQSGNMEAAYKGIKEIIETALHVFGEDRASTYDLFLNAVFRLATIATNIGHQEEAFGWLNWLDRGIQDGAIERSLVESNLVLGFATMYENLGQFDRALPFAERSVHLCDSKKKPIAKHTVASIYSNLGQRDKAVTINKQIYKEARKELGSSHRTTKWAKQRLADLEDYWDSAEASGAQAEMTASKGRAVTIGVFHGLANRNDLNGSPAEIRLFSREKKQYLVQFARGDGSRLYVKPSNIIFNRHTSVYVHGLQNASQYNGKVGTTRDYSNKNGRYTVELQDPEKLITVKPENLLAQYQPDLVFDTTLTLSQMISHPYACY